MNNSDSYDECPSCLPTYGIIKGVRKHYEHLFLTFSKAIGIFDSLLSLNRCPEAIYVVLCDQMFFRIFPAITFSPECPNIKSITYNKPLNNNEELTHFFAYKKSKHASVAISGESAFVSVNNIRRKPNVNHIMANTRFRLLNFLLKFVGFGQQGGAVNIVTRFTFLFVTLTTTVMTFTHLLVLFREDMYKALIAFPVVLASSGNIGNYFHILTHLDDFYLVLKKLEKLASEGELELS